MRIMSELSFEWGSNSARPSSIKKAAELVKPKVEVTIDKLHECRCSSKHKTPETFIKCALKKYKYNGVAKAALPQINVKGSGVWATIHESLSGIYYSYSYDNEQEYAHEHQYLDVVLFETLEEAAEWQKFQRRFCQSSTKCSDSCNGVGMLGYVAKIVL
jgi:hypothetical protein